MNPFKMLGLMLPSLCFLYLGSWSGPWAKLSTLPERHESFGNPQYYLDIQLEGIPHRLISGSKQPEAMFFKGILASEKKEQAIVGKRVRVQGQTWYVFETGDFRFLGWLTPQAKQGLKVKTSCEPNLEFRLEKNGKLIETGRMRAGFC